MRYLTLAATYTTSCLRDDLNGPIDVQDLNLSHDLRTDLQEWNEQYKTIIPLDMEERVEGDVATLIENLDAQGHALAQRLAEDLGDAKVRYYSEGRLKYLP